MTNRFSKNVMDGIKAYELYVGTERLAGVPPRLIEATAADAEAHGHAGEHRLTLHGPVLSPVLTYADDRSLREELSRANNLVGIGEGRDNRELLPEILRLRRERAALLGFATFADLVTADRMSGSAGAALAFERDLEARTRPFFERENQELQDFYRQQSGEAAPELAPWDISYWAEKLRQARYDFDEEALRPYFPMAQVLSGMFEITRRVFGITVKEVQAPGWHPEVKYYDIHNEAGEHVASFYTDWFPRDSKRGGAWMNALYTGGPREDGFAPHLGLMCGNLNPPSGETPALLSVGEVETVFHEFGHLLHHALSRVPVRSLSGTRVAWDFVELPSQIMENWVWTPEGLALIAQHYQTGESLPDDLYQQDAARPATFAPPPPPCASTASAPSICRCTPSTPRPTATCWPTPATCSAATRRCRRCRTAPLLPSSATCFPVRWATRAATTATNGPRCSTPTPFPASSRKGSSTARPGANTWTSCSHAAARWTPGSSTATS